MVQAPHQSDVQGWVKLSVNTLAKFISDPEGVEFRKFKAFLLAVIEHFIKVGGISSRRLPWEQIDKQILCIEKTLQHKFTDHKDQFWAYDYYKNEKGSPDTNGLGHKAMIIEGVKGVLIPSALPCLSLQ